MGAALCFKQQMVHVGTRCPLHLAVADHINGSALSNNSMAALGQAYGEDRIILLSSLLEAAVATGQRAHGRRLFASALGKAITTSKILLWALPPSRFPKVAFIDVDVLVLRNVDSLLQDSLNESVAAVPMPIACGYERPYALFNGGVVIFRPSLADARGLLDTERHVRSPWHGFFPLSGPSRRSRSNQSSRWADVCSPASEPFRYKALFPGNQSFRDCRLHYNGTLTGRMTLACERTFTDQSIMNHHFRSRWQPLDRRFNQDARRLSGHAIDCKQMHNPEKCSASIAHFIGEPKPWKELQRSRSVRDGADLRLLWRERCSPFVRDLT